MIATKVRASLRPTRADVSFGDRRVPLTGARNVLEVVCDKETACRVSLHNYVFSAVPCTVLVSPKKYTGKTSAFFDTFTQRRRQRASASKYSSNEAGHFTQHSCQVETDRTKNHYRQLSTFVEMSCTSQVVMTLRGEKLREKGSRAQRQ